MWLSKLIVEIDRHQTEVFGVVQGREEVFRVYDAGALLGDAADRDLRDEMVAEDAFKSALNEGFRQEFYGHLFRRVAAEFVEGHPPLLDLLRERFGNVRQHPFIRKRPV